MKSKTEIVVVGAGIIGVAIALRLQRAGHSVTLLDRSAPGQGASFGNMACIAVTEFLPISRPSMWRQLPRWLLDSEGPVHVRPSALLKLSPWLLRFVKAGFPQRRTTLTHAGAILCHRAVRDFRELTANANAQDLVASTGGALRLYISAQDQRNDSDSLAELGELGFQYRRMTGHEVRELEPQLSESVYSGALLPQWLLVKDPFELTRRVVAAFTSRGGLVQQAQVTGFVSDGRRIRALVLASGKKMAAERIVLACGAWTARLTRQLHDYIPLETERGYHTQLSNPGITLERALIIPGHGYAISPVAGGIRVGGTVELGGLAASPNYRRARILVQRAKRLLPALNIQEGTEWMGHRPALPDTIPVISRATHFDNVYYATGHGHLGLTLAATTSVLINELIDGNTSSVDTDHFGVGRF